MHRRNRSKALLVIAFAFIIGYVDQGKAPAASSLPATDKKQMHPQGGNLHALVVGVARYRDPKIPALKLADNDAMAFSEFLKSQKKVFKETHVKLLLNEQATKSEMEKFLYYTLHKVGKQDTVILFFSGHGACDPLRPSDFLFLSYDAEPEYLGATAVKMSGLDFLKGMEAERILIIADACHAGGFSQMKPKATFQVQQQFLNEIRSSSGCAVIASGRGDQLSWEVPNLKNSVFTHTLIEGLKGKADTNHDGIVTLQEAYQYAYNKTREHTGGHQHPQLELGKLVGSFPLSFVGPAIPPGELRRQFFIAAKNGDSEKLNSILSFGVEVDTRDEENETALIIAARNGHTNAVKLLLERGSDVEAKNNSRITPLAAAAAKAHVHICRLLLPAGANPNAKSVDGMTPLALAARRGSLETVKLLLAHGADIKSRTETGRTALALASAEGHLEVVKLLVQAGSDINTQDLEGATAWSEAARNGHAAVVRFLVDHDALVEAKSGNPLDSRLLMAALCNDLDGAVELLSQGASVDARTKCGDTALALASGLGHISFITMLLERNANPNLRIRGESTSLLLACRNGQTKVTEALLTGTAYVDATDKEGNTGLLLAARFGHQDIVKLLLSRGADVQARNRRGATALLLASENGHISVVRTLIGGGANVNAADGDGNTPLLLSSKRGHLDIARMLLDRKADINAPNMRGITPLIAATTNGNKGLVKLLIERGADLSLTDWEGKTALQIAGEQGLKEIVELLSSRPSVRADGP